MDQYKNQYKNLLKIAEKRQEDIEENVKKQNNLNQRYKSIHKETLNMEKIDREYDEKIFILESSLEKENKIFKDLCNDCFQLDNFENKISLINTSQEEFKISMENKVKILQQSSETFSQMAEIENKDYIEPKIVELNNTISTVDRNKIEIKKKNASIENRAVPKDSLDLAFINEIKFETFPKIPKDIDEEIAKTKNQIKLLEEALDEYNN